MRSNDSIRILVAGSDDLSEVSAFYARHGYSHGDLSKDFVVVARKENRLVGVGRICAEHGFQILRGMQVDDECQREGVGRAILARLDEAIGPRECFTLPWAHLEQFYGSIGFVKISPKDAPPHLRDRSEEYYRRHGNIIAMGKSAQIESSIDRGETGAFKSPQSLIKDYESKINLHIFESIEPHLSDEAVFWFSDGSYSGKDAIRKAFEKTWNTIQDEKYWLENLTWIATGDKAACCTYEFHWKGIISGNLLSGKGRGTTTFRVEAGRWKIVHEHLSNFPK